jgi:serine/threonine-protein kinase
MSFRVGDTVGEYKIVGPLGRGGMGQVFRVEHALTKRIEAMKVLVKHPLEGAEPVSRFMREVKIHASLNHPNIVTVHNAFQVGEDLALVMELVDGRSLKELIREGGLTLESAVRAVSGALAGLEYAHQRNIIHRDISPSNIIVTADGVAKLMDFGLSKVVAEPALGQSGVVLGTVYYCSPEQVRSTNLDARSDIYSLGVVLYEAVTGRRPFESETAFNIMMDHVDTAPVPPIDVKPEVPRALSDMILKAMAKDPAARFQTAGDFRRSLEGVLDGLGQKSAAAPRPKPLSWHSLAEDCARLCGRRSVQIGLVALGLAFPAMVVYVNVAAYRAATPDRPVAHWPAPAVPAEALEILKPQPAVLESAPPAEVPQKTLVSTRPVSKPVQVAASAEPEAPAAPIPAPEPPPQAIEAESPPANAPVAADPQKPNGLKRFFGKVFHRRAKGAAGADESSEPPNGAKP